MGWIFCEATRRHQYEALEFAKGIAGRLGEIAMMGSRHDA